ncbi:MAG: bacillithiol biosynthesis BshC [Candidatus Eisenbacteria bacterium]|uniref:Bacillithiol biosynthesis BshC n=1 Tax=Eiseniibacteriota bacterium TaxID=2212470 RepID=A0A849SUA8_UNCEI|nr:bacillithiol biosynthesis BshC [Candidatus Eisenbacteria bacterium]
MPLTTGTGLIARIEIGADPRLDRLRDPFSQALLTRAPLAQARYATHWADTDALRRLAESKRAPLDPALATELRAYHERLGAGPASLANLERLARGEAVTAISGQQPAPLGGPLYGLHKTGATAGLARRVTARTGVPCVPMFWTHAEDSDFEEIRGATVGDAGLTLHDLALDASSHHDGGLVGAIPVAPVAALIESAATFWDGLPSASAALALARGALALARDLGELQSALLLAVFRDVGLVVVDPRLPAFRSAARPVIERYLERAERASEQARAAGERLERETGRRPLVDASLDSFLFAIEGDRRHKLSLADARASAATQVLTPSVALRPVVQDAVLPTVAMACGPGELAYLAQLREVFELLEVHAAVPVPRYGATWLPAAARELIAAAGADPWEVVTHTDAVVRGLGESRIPESLRASLRDARARASAELERVAAESRSLEPSLPQMVESARGKVDFQYARLEEGFAAKARHRLEREHPEWGRLRYYLAPADKLQERRLASLEPLAYRGIAVGNELAALSEEHAARLEQGVACHDLIAL